jgi:acetyl-CoA acetyltransferase
MNQFPKRFFSRNVVLVSGKRTPIGTFMGGLSNFTAPSLGQIAVRGALEQANLDPKEARKSELILRFRKFIWET